MAPVRRYLRITKHSVLEVRVYLDSPADADAWLLKRDNPALPRVIQAVRPLVLPKLREENERGKGKGGARSKKKGVKDVVVEDDFEVSIFLTELSSRHSVLTKQKIFKDKARVRSNSGKLTNWLTGGTSDQPVLIREDATTPVVIRDEEDDDAINLADIPEAGNTGEVSGRSQRTSDSIGGPEEATTGEANDSDDSTLFVSGRSRKRRIPKDDGDNNEDALDDKKKIGLNTSYDGFSIYGRILCLVVKRRGGKQAGAMASASSQQMMEQWVSTQAATEQIDDDEDIG